jgi:hypothetical protein
MTPEELTCPRCRVVVDQATDNHVWEYYTKTYATISGETTLQDFGVFHVDCMMNNDKPEQYRECEVCHKTGKDIEGMYPSNYRNGYAIEHPTCIDWDDARKNRLVELNN